jgi:hypothetical protein
MPQHQSLTALLTTLSVWDGGSEVNRAPSSHGRNTGKRPWRDTDGAASRACSDFTRSDQGISSGPATPRADTFSAVPPGPGSIETLRLDDEQIF